MTDGTGQSAKITPYRERVRSLFLDRSSLALTLLVLISAFALIVISFVQSGETPREGPFATPVAFTKMVSLALLSGALALRGLVPRLAVLMAAIAVLIAGMTLAEYVFRLSIDFGGEPIQRFQSDPSGALDRMSFACAAAMAVLALGITGFIRWPASTVVAAFALAASVVSFGLLLSGYALVNLRPSGEFYSPLIEVNPKGAALVASLCAAQILLSIRALWRAGSLRVDHYLAWSTTLLAGLVLLFWQYQEQSDWAQRGYETRIARDTVISNLSVELVGRGIAQQRLANRWSIYGAPTEEQWLSDASALLTDFPGIFAIAYVGTDRVVRWRVARDGNNEGFIGRSLDRDPDRRDAFETSARMNAVRVTPSVELLSGRRGNVFFTPIFVDGAFVGHVVSSVTSDELIGLSQSDSTSGFLVHIHDSGGAVAGEPPRPDEPGYGLRQSGSFFILGQTWEVDVWPTEVYLAERRSRSLGVMVGLGLLGVVLVGAAFAQTRFSLMHRTRAEDLAQRLAMTLETINEGFMTVGPDWTVTYVNRKACEILGWDIAHVTGRRLEDLAPAFPGSVVEALLSGVVQRNETDRLVILRPNGKQWLELTAHPAGVGVALYLRDVTSEREREVQLRLLEAAVARQNDVLIITEIVTEGEEAGLDSPRILYVNEAFTRLTGWHRDEVLGRSPRLLQGPATSRAELDRIKAALMAREPVRAELINYTKDGREYWIELDIASLADSTGRYTHHVAVERDITARKQAEAASALRDERLQQVVAATNGVIWDADLVTGAVWYNETVRSAFGYDPVADHDILQGWEDLIHPDDRVRAIRKAKAVLDGTENTLVDEYRLRKADGTYAYVIDRARVIRNADGHAVRLVGAMVDETERREMELRLRQAQRLETVGQLTGGVAHDFNNLLTVILGNAELLSERLEDRPALREMAEMAIRAASRGAELSNRLLAFARRQPLDPRKIEVGSLLEAMKGLLERTLSETIELRVVSGASCWPIMADPVQLESAVLNLVLNARDAMPRGGTITIRIDNLTLSATEAARQTGAEAGDYLQISVEDTGEGMAPEVQSRVLEPFFTTKGPGKGTGLGLSMVYGFVSQSGGFLRIDSTPGKGSRIDICFPRAPGQRSAKNAAPANGSDAERPSAGLPGGSEHILMVEDDPMVRENVSHQLMRLGYHVSVAGSGREALAMLSDGLTVDLLFTDVVMPGDLDGRELADAVRLIRPELPVLFTSGYADALLRDDGVLEPGLQLLGKPYHLSDLAAKVRAILDARDDETGQRRPKAGMP